MDEPLRLILGQLKEMHDCEDLEHCHLIADDLLVDVIRVLANRLRLDIEAEKIIEAYRQVEKQYA